MNDGRFDYVGDIGYGWSRVSQSSTLAYSLGMGPTNVNPSGINYCWLAFPLRCLYNGNV